MIRVVSHYDINKSCITYEMYIKWILKNNFKYAIITENSMAGFIEFINLCKEYKIIPIWGLNVNNDYIAFPINNRGVEKTFLLSNNKSIEYSDLIIYNLSSENNFINAKNVKQLNNNDIYNTLYETILEEQILGNKVNTLTPDKYIIDNILLNIKIDYDSTVKINHIENNYELLKKIIKKEIGNRKLEEEEKKQIKYELSVIKSKNFETYFLNFYRIVNFLNSNSIEFGYGRGSSPSSYILYLLGITKINPIKNKLTFERFINLKRNDYPDIDLDVDASKKNIVDEYILSTFNNSFKISTYIKYSSKELLQIFNTKYKLPELIINKISNNEYKDLTLVDSNVEKIINDYEKYINLNKSKSVHNVGLVITNENYHKYTQVENKISNFDKKSLENTGFIKIDILPLSLISKMQKLKKMLKENNKVKPQISLNDKNIFKMINNFELSYLFQIDTNLAKNILKKFKITSFKDIVILISLNRPGTSNLIDEIVSKKKSSNHETYGVMIFQEQILKLLNKAYKIDLGTSEIIRKAILKKDNKVVSKLEKWLIENNLDTKVISVIKTYSKYSFNKSHAYSYAYTLYEQAFYKYYFPAEYFLVFSDDNLTLDDFIFLKQYKIKIEKYVPLKKSYVKKNYIYPSIKNLKINTTLTNLIISNPKLNLDLIRREYKINDHDIKQLIFSNTFKNNLSTSEKFEIENNNINSLVKLKIFREKEEIKLTNYEYKEFLYFQLKEIGYSFDKYFKNDQIIEIEYVEKIKNFYKGTCLSNFGRLNFILFSNYKFIVGSKYFIKFKIDHSYNYNTLIVEEVISEVE